MIISHLVSVPESILFIVRGQGLCNLMRSRYAGIPIPIIQSLRITVHKHLAVPCSGPKKGRGNVIVYSLKRLILLRKCLCQLCF